MTWNYDKCLICWCSEQLTQAVATRQYDAAQQWLTLKWLVTQERYIHCINSNVTYRIMCLDEALRLVYSDLYNINATTVNFCQGCTEFRLRKSKIRQFFINPAKSGSGQISSRICRMPVQLQYVWYTEIKLMQLTSVTCQVVYSHF